MNLKRTILALASAMTLLSSVGGTFASIEVTHYEGSREQLRAMCHKLRGELIETQSKTRCNTLTGVTYICKDSGHCVKQDQVTAAFDPMTNGGSLSSSNPTFYKKEPPKKGDTM